MNRKFPVSGLLLAFAVSTTSIAGAATSVSPKFDGTYVGGLSPNVALSTGKCDPVQSYGVNISRGMLKGSAPVGKGSAQAIVTEDGFVTGSIAMNGHTYPMEGRIANGKLLAAVIAGDCTWLVDLTKKT